MEQHVKDEIGRQLDYYADAYGKVRELDLRLASLSEEMGALSAERSAAERMRDEAADAVNAIVADVHEEDEDEVRALVDEHLSCLVGLLVF